MLGQRRESNRRTRRGLGIGHHLRVHVQQEHVTTGSTCSVFRANIDEGHELQRSLKARDADAPRRASRDASPVTGHPASLTCSPSAHIRRVRPHFPLFPHVQASPLFTPLLCSNHRKLAQLCIHPAPCEDRYPALRHCRCSAGTQSYSHLRQPSSATCFGLPSDVVFHIVAHASSALGNFDLIPLLRLAP